MFTIIRRAFILPQSRGLPEIVVIDNFTYLGIISRATLTGNLFEVH